MVLRDREIVKFPECLGCVKIMSMRWEPTGALVRVCGIYLSPKSWWRRGTCPIIFKHVEGPEKKRWGHEKKRGNR